MVTVPNVTAITSVMILPTTEKAMIKKIGEEEKGGEKDTEGRKKHEIYVANYKLRVMEEGNFLLGDLYSL